MSETAMTGEVRSAEDSQLTLRGWALDWDRQQRFGMARAAREAAEALTRLNHECAAERERREAVEGELARVKAERDGRQELLGKALNVLNRCYHVLFNMAQENEGAIFNRWPIHHEPLRSDARNLLPLINEVLGDD